LALFVLFDVVVQFLLFWFGLRF